MTKNIYQLTRQQAALLEHLATGAPVMVTPAGKEQIGDLVTLGLVEEVPNSTFRNNTLYVASEIGEIMFAPVCNNCKKHIN